MPRHEARRHGPGYSRDRFRVAHRNRSLTLLVITQSPHEGEGYRQVLKIVDIHLSPSPQCEYIVLQNQGLQTVSLRGWAVVTDRWFWAEPGSAAPETYVFRGDVAIRPYTRVVLFTGEGEEGWCPTVDGKQAYLVYWGRRDSAWHESECLHLVHVASSLRVTARHTTAATTSG